MKISSSPSFRNAALVLAVVAGAVLVAPESQALITKDSADFNYKYEADVLPNEILPSGDSFILRAGTGGGANSAVISSGILETASPAASYQYYETRAANWLDVADLSLGFTAEIRVKVDAGKTFGGIQLGFNSDTALGAGLGGLLLTGDDTQWLGTGVVDTGDNDDGYHVFRIVKLASTVGVAGKFNVYRDGTLIVDDLAGADPGFDPPNRFFFGDYGSWDSAGDVDYFRWDTTGAYAPVPEPSTLGLMGAALALGLLRRQRRRA